MRVAEISMQRLTINWKYDDSRKTYTVNIFGNFLSLVPFTKSKEGGPFFTLEYKNNLNHTEFTSGMAGPMWGGVQLDIGRISLLNGAIDIKRLGEKKELERVCKWRTTHDFKKWFQRSTMVLKMS